MEIELSRTTWHLREGPHPKEVFQQFLCQPETQSSKQARLPTHATVDFGRPVRPKDGNTVQMRIDMQEIATRSRISPALLIPDWSAQRFRMAVPCVGTDRYHWRRAALVTTLGQILRALGDAVLLLLFPADCCCQGHTRRVLSTSSHKTSHGL